MEDDDVLDLASYWFSPWIYFWRQLFRTELPEPTPVLCCR